MSGGTSLSSHQKFKTHKLRHFPRIEVKGGRRAQIISNDFTEKLHHNFETGSWRPDGRAALLGQQIAINALTIYLSLGWHGRFSLILRNDTNKKNAHFLGTWTHTHKFGLPSGNGAAQRGGDRAGGRYKHFFRDILQSCWTRAGRVLLLAKRKLCYTWLRKGRWVDFFL